MIEICSGTPSAYLEQEAYAEAWHQDMMSQSTTGHFIKQFPWLFRMQAWFPMLMSPEKKAGMAASKKRRDLHLKEMAAFVERHARKEKNSGGRKTIFDSMLDADVPPEEKSVLRLAEEAQTLVGAGSLTTARALETTLYYLLLPSSSHYLSRLRAELEAAIPDPTTTPTLTTLEKLSFLSAVIHEGLRLSTGVPHRLARVSPDTDYPSQITSLTIPRGVPVGMTSLFTLLNPAIFPSPNEFLPERWLPLDTPHFRELRKSVTTIFGGGTRQCLGMNLAWAELYLGVATVLRRLGRRLELFQTEYERDMKIVRDGFNPITGPNSRGLRVTISSEEERVGTIGFA